MNLADVLADMGLSCECRGDVSFEHMGLAVSDPGGPMLTFAESSRYVGDLRAHVSCVICPPALDEQIERKGFGVCVTEDPRALFFSVHNHLAGDARYVRPRFATSIGEGCNISPHACVAEENVVIGAGSTVEEFASIKPNTVIGEGCVIRAGSVVGGEGFEVKRIAGEVVTVRHLGGVHLGANVEVQQNACIDKAVYPWDDTVLGDGCRIDNLVHVAHGVKMGCGVEVAAVTCVAGRVVLGDDVWVGPGSTIRNGIEVGAGARVNMGSVVSQDVPAGSSVTGNFAIEHRRFLRNVKIASSESLRRALDELGN